MSYHHIPLGSRSPEVVNTVIEIPKSSSNKYEYDEEFDEIRLDRVLHTAMHYPIDYGFIPQTRSEDGDHLDVLVVVSTPLFSGCVVAARPIGVVDMEDEAGQDWKIIAVADGDPRLREVRSVEDLGAHFKKEIEHFFEEYKTLEGKWSNVKGWLPKEAAHRVISEGQIRFSRELSDSILPRSS